MMTPPTATQQQAPRAASPMLEARRIVGDLFEHRPAIYWSDLLLSAAVAWSGLVAACRHPAYDLWFAALVLISAFATLRATLFIHEMSHFRRGVLPGFMWVWNLLVGTLTMAPSFTYVGSHADHHKRTLYGTIRDPEYLPLARLPRWRLPAFVAPILLATPALVLRWGLLAPLSFVIAPLRRFVVARLSSLVINPDYLRRMPTGGERRHWLILEVGMMLVVWAGVALTLTGVLTPRILFTWWLVTTVAAVINQVRTLAAHHYENDGRELSTAEQLRDSVTVRGVPLLTELVFPVGLKFHALHHFLPDLPYHALPEAHRRLHRTLDQRLDEPIGYDGTQHPGLMSVVKRLLAYPRRGAEGLTAWRREA